MHSSFIARTSISSLKGRILTCGTRGTPEFGCQSLDLNLNTADVLLNLIGIARKTKLRKHSVARHPFIQRNVQIGNKDFSEFGNMFVQSVALDHHYQLFS